MAFLQRKNPKEAEIQRLKKQENRFLKKGAEKKSTYLDQLIAERVPNKLQETLDAAFAKSFTLIFEKGTNIIEKTYNREDLERTYKVSHYAAELKEDSKTLRAFSKKAGSTGLKNMALSGVSGIGMGFLGIGLPDIPVFTAMLLKSIYEIALSYGFDYESEKERYFILLIIQGAVSYGEEMLSVNERVNTFMKVEQLPENYIQNEMVIQTAGFLSKELLYMKFIQGIPVVGVIGGAYDVIYMKKVVEYAKLKYCQRFYCSAKI